MKREVSGVRKSWQNQVDLHVHAHIIGGDVQDKWFFSEWPPSSVTGLASTKKEVLDETVFGWLILPQFCVCISWFSYLGLWLGVCICQDSPALASRVWETLEGAAVQSRQVSGGRLCPPSSGPAVPLSGCACSVMKIFWAFSSSENLVVFLRFRQSCSPPTDPWQRLSINLAENWKWHKLVTAAEEFLVNSQRWHFGTLGLNLCKISERSCQSKKVRFYSPAARSCSTGVPNPS